MKVIKSVLVVAIAAMVVSCNNQGITKKSLDNSNDTVSYVLGLDIAFKLKANFSDVDRDLFIQGFVNGIDSTDLKIEPGKVDVILREFFQKKQEADRLKQQEAAIKKAETEFADVKVENEKFLEDNKGKDGVVTTESGLQYVVLKQGKGENAKGLSTVKVHYHGTLIDGTVFDSSVDRGTPSEFGVSRVIKGWTEGLQLMNPGSKFKFFIPQELAYGATPRPGGKIKPFNTLIFEVELIEIVK